MLRNRHQPLPIKFRDLVFEHKENTIDLQYPVKIRNEHDEIEKKEQDKFVFQKKHVSPGHFRYHVLSQNL